MVGERQLSNEPAHLTRDEAAERLKSLTLAEKGRLKGIAIRFARVIGSGTWEDLAQEAYSRALAGSRKWPAGLDVIPFLTGIMRSIASAEWEKKKVTPTLITLVGPVGDLASSSDPLDGDASPEEALIGKQLREKLVGLFDGDFDAQIICEGMLERMEGEALKELTSLDQVAFDSKRRLVRRKINKAFDEGIVP